ncbi:hypothetical protein ACFX15_023790 [Malus domestica]
MVPSESWTSNCPNFFFNRNLHTLFTAHRENIASIDFAIFHGNMAANFTASLAPVPTRPLQSIFTALH